MDPRHTPPGSRSRPARDGHDTVRRAVRALCSPQDKPELSREAGFQAGPASSLIPYALRHGLAPLLWHRLSRGRGTSRSVVPPVSPALDPGEEILRQSYLSAMRRAMEMHTALRALDRVLSGSGARCLVWKGAALGHTVYPHPALRPMDDADLLVPSRHLEDVLHALKTLGFHPRRAYPLVWQRQRVVLDLHLDAAHGDRIRARLRSMPLSAERLAAASRPLDGFTRLRRLGAVDTLITSAVHAMKHGFSRDIWLVDVLFLLDRNPGLLDDPEPLQQRVRERGAMLPLRLLAGLLDDWPGRPGARLSDVFREGRPGWIERRFLEAAGSQRPLPNAGEVLFWAAAGSTHGRAAYLRDTLFPPPVVMAQIFRKDRPRSWLPYYPLRLFRVAVQGAAAVWGLLRG